MTKPLHLPLAQAIIDRDGAARDSAELFDQLWSEPETRILVLHNGRL